MDQRLLLLIYSCLHQDLKSLTLFMYISVEALVDLYYPYIILFYISLTHVISDAKSLLCVALGS